MADDWHYSSGGKKNGPVSPIALKRLAETGILTPTDLVWREGMQQWVPARAVKGLFPESPTAQPPAAAAPLPAATPTPRRALPSSDWHPLDSVIDAARAACPNDLAETISGVAGQIGVLALYVSAAITLIGGILLAVRGNSFGAFVAGVGVTIGVLVGQYIAYRLLGACRTAIVANRSILSSLAIPDSVSLLIAVATIAGVIGLIWTSIQAGQLVFFVAASGVLAVGAFAALTAVTPAGLSVDVEPDCRAAQEAVGVLTFVVKLILRCTPLLFASGVAFATYRLIASVVFVMKAEAREGFLAQQDVAAAVSILFAVIAIPIYAYVVMLLYYLTLDVIAAIVSLPGKLDLIAERSDEARR
jgi:hypothetical protein